MNLFKKKETLVQNMAFMAIVSTINVIISLLAGLNIAFSLIIVIFLPLISALTEIICKDKYYPIYAFASIGLCLVATLWNIETTIFYVIPSIITGFIFGVILKHQLKPIYSIVLASLAQCAMTYASIPFIKVVLDIDIIYTFKVALGLTESAAFDIIVPAAILTISFIEMALAYFIIQGETEKFGLKIEDNSNDLIVSIATIIASLAIIGFYFLNLKIAYFLLFISLFLMVYLFIKNISEKKVLQLVLDSVMIVAAIIVYILLNDKLATYSGLLLLGIAPLGISIINLVYSFLKKPNNRE